MYQKTGVAVLAISIDGDGARAVQSFIAEHHYTLPMPLDQHMHVARAVGVRVAPWTVVIDRSGAVVAGGYGAIDLLSPAFVNYVKALSAKPPG
mgnify:CR=1 FL=1